MNKDEIINLLTQQILAQGTSGQWSGQGLGSAEANAADMARIMADAGMTDIGQFGKVTQKSQVQVIPQYENVSTGYDSEGGETFGRKLVGYTDADGNPLNAADVQARQDRINNEDFETNYYARTGADEDAGWGNTATNTAFANTYSERQNGDAWGGTFAGKGNTGYRVQMSPDGTPVFYTTGASSNDLANILDNPVMNAAANAAAFTFGGPLGSGALQLAQGNSLEDAAKSTLLSYAGQQLGNYVKGSDGLLGSLDSSAADYAAYADGTDALAGSDLASSWGNGVTVGRGIPNANITTNDLGNLNNRGLIGGLEFSAKDFANYADGTDALAGSDLNSLSAASGWSFDKITDWAKANPGKAAKLGLTVGGALIGSIDGSSSDTGGSTYAPSSWTPVPSTIGQPGSNSISGVVPASLSMPTFQTNQINRNIQLSPNQMVDPTVLAAQQILNRPGSYLTAQQPAGLLNTIGSK